MSERDRQYIDAIKANFKDAVSNDKAPRRKLTNEIIATFFILNGEQLNDRKLNYQLKKEEHFFNVSNLLILKKGVGNYINGSKYAYKVTGFIRQLCIAQMIEEGIDISELIHDAQSYDETIKLFFVSAESVFMNVSFDNGSSVRMCQMNLMQTLQVLLSFPCAIPQLNITVCKSDTESTIKIIKDWAYGKDGNFTNRLEVNIFEHSYISSQTISGIVDGELIAYIAHGDNYYPLSDMAKDVVQENMNAMMTETAAWSLPKSPEVRALKYMYYDYDVASLCSNDERKLTDATWSDLMQLVTDAYEENPIVEKGNVFVRLSEFLVPQVDEDIADILRNYFEFLHLKNP